MAAWRVALLAAALLVAGACAQQNGSFTAGAAVTVSSNEAGPLGNIVDGLDNTQWQSGACFPTDYTTRPDMAPLIDACATTGRCTASDGATNLAAAADVNPYTGAGVPLPKGAVPGAPAAFVQVALPAPATVLRASFKGSGGQPMEMVLVGADGSTTSVGELLPANNYQWAHADGSWPNIAAIRVQSTAGFTATEVAVQTGPCLQWATVDMGSVRDIGRIRARVWSGNDSSKATLQASTDGTTWTDVKALDPQFLGAVNVTLDTAVQARYLRVLHEITDKTGWRKVYVWGIDAFRGTAPLPPAVLPPAVLPPADPVAPKIPEKMGTWIPFYTWPGTAFDDLINSVEANDCIRGSFKAAVLIGPTGGPPNPKTDKLQRTYFEKIANKSEWTTFGYLHIGYGERPLSEVLAQIDTWLDPVDGFGDIIQGVWVNQVPPEMKTQELEDYMAAVVERIRWYRKLVALNPGRAMDCAMVSKLAPNFVNYFEGNLTTWARTKPVCACSDATRCIASIHGYSGGTTATDLASLMGTARNAGFEAIYVTDRRQPDQYDGLPRFWAQELEGLCKTTINA